MNKSPNPDSKYKLTRNMLANLAKSGIGSREDLSPDPGLEQDDSAEFQKMVKDLSLPVDIVDIIAEMPEEI